MATKEAADRALKEPNPIIDGRKANVNLAILGAKPRGNLTGERSGWLEWRQTKLLISINYTQKIARSIRRLVLEHYKNKTRSVKALSQSSPAGSVLVDTLSLVWSVIINVSRWVVVVVEVGGGHTHDIYGHYQDGEFAQPELN